MADPVLSHHAAVWSSQTAPSGRLRWRGGKLQQEWTMEFGNELGRSVVCEWHDVPTDDE